MVSPQMPPETLFGPAHKFVLTSETGGHVEGERFKPIVTNSIPFVVDTHRHSPYTYTQHSTQ
jgi:hypothetical protein